MTIASGTRYSVLVQLDQTPGDYRITLASVGFNQKIAGYGVLSYLNGDPSVVGTPSMNYGGVTIGNASILDEHTIEPLIQNRPSQESNSTYILTIGRFEKAWKWSLNGNHTFGLELEEEKPMLWDPQSQKDSDLVIATKNGTWVDIIFDVAGTDSTSQPGHPIHKHSNAVYVIVSWTDVVFS